MFSIASLLERAKARGNIESDYRLAKILGITHAAISTYRVGKSLPGDKVIEQLCALSGDDAQLIFAQVQESKASSAEGKHFWSVMIQRLSNGASTAILSVLFAIGLVALPAQEARAEPAQALKAEAVNLLYIVLSGVFVRWGRLRRFSGLWRLSLWLN